MMAAGLSDFSKDIKIVDGLSKLHLQSIRGIVERRLTPAETVHALEYTEDGHVRGLTQTLRDCLELRSGFEFRSFPKDMHNYYAYRNNLEQNITNGYEPNINTSINVVSTRRKEKYKYHSSIKLPALKSHSLFQQYPELVSYRGGPLRIYPYKVTFEENMRWVQRNGENGNTNAANRQNLGLNENGNNGLTFKYDNYVLYIALMPLWTGEVYVYIYWLTDIPEPHLSGYIQEIQNALTMCARPAPLPVLGNIPRGARRINYLGTRRAFGRLSANIVNEILKRRGPGDHLARRRKTRKQHK